MTRSHRARGSIYERKDSPFLWIAYSVNGRKFRQNTHTTKVKEAKKKLDKRLGEIASGTFDIDVTTTKATMDDLAQAYLRDYRISGKKSLTHAQVRWEKHLRPFFMIYQARQVTSELIARYIDSRQAAGAKNSTINRELSALKRMFRLALASSPPKVLRVPKIPHLKEDPPRQGFLEDGAQRLLFEYCPESWFRVAVEIGRIYGWRISEVKALRVRQVDFAERTISLDPGTTKNGEGRCVTIRPDLLLLLQGCTQGKEPDDFLLTRPSGNPIKDFRRLWGNATRFAGCEGLMFHDLRRTAARNLRRAGVSEGVIMKIGGWKTRTVFDRYNILDRSDVEDAMLRSAAAEKAQAEQKTELGHDSVTAAPPGKSPMVN